MNTDLQPSLFEALPFQLRASIATPLGVRLRQTCIDCCGSFDLEYGFAVHRVYRTRIVRHLVCIGCQQEKRDAAKQDNRWLIKARDTLGRHARKYNAKHETKFTAKEFSRKFFWVPERIAHDLKHASENTCSYCWRPYTEMPAGIAAVTLDIRDRSAEPFYHINVAVCCNTCNTEKGQMSPEQWQGRLQYWKEKQEYDAQTGRRRIDLPIFNATAT